MSGEAVVDIGGLKRVFILIFAWLVKMWGMQEDISLCGVVVAGSVEDHWHICFYSLCVFVVVDVVVIVVVVLFCCFAMWMLSLLLLLFFFADSHNHCICVSTFQFNILL